MYVITNVPKDILDQLDREIHKKSLERFNHNLAGNLKQEYSIPEAKPILMPFMNACVQEHSKQFSYFKNAVETLSSQKELKFLSLWVNFQQKHEFNPVHKHSGLFSFVIWHKIPYTFEEEAKRFPHMKKDECQAGCFNFIYTDPLGKVETEAIRADKSFEGKIAFFPAKLAHCVYPFYTSDEYRITVSGNLVFDV